VEAPMSNVRRLPLTNAAKEDQEMEADSEGRWTDLKWQSKKKSESILRALAFVNKAVVESQEWKLNE
jgi:hypothetical protein